MKKKINKNVKRFSQYYIDIYDFYTNLMNSALLSSRARNIFDREQFTNYN